MENYRERIKRRMALLSAWILLTAGLGIYNVFCTADETGVPEIFGFQCGLACGLSLCALLLLLRYGRALKDERGLQKLYNQEHDKRMKAVRAKAGVPMVPILSFIMMGVGMVMGYTNSVIFYTLTAAAMGQLLVSSAAKLVYLRRM